MFFVLSQLSKPIGEQFHNPTIACSIDLARYSAAKDIQHCEVMRKARPQNVHKTDAFVFIGTQLLDEGSLIMFSQEKYIFHTSRIRGKEGLKPIITIRGRPA